MALAIFFCAVLGSLSLVSFCLSPPRLADAAISDANVQAVPSKTATRLAAAVIIVRLRMVSSPVVGVPARAGGGAIAGQSPHTYLGAYDAGQRDWLIGLALQRICRSAFPG